MMLSIILFIFCGWTIASSAESKKIELTSESLLLYFDNIESKYDFQNLSKICKDRSYAYTVYYRVLYFRFCGFENSSSRSNDFNKFCDNLDSYYNDSVQSQTVNDVKLSIKVTADQHQIFGHGLESDELWQAHMTCKSIRDYYLQKDLIDENNSHFHDMEWIQQPNYTEWYLHALPFCLPISCGFTKHSYYNGTPHPAAFDCMPPSYKVAFYIMLCIDALIIFATVLANVLIIIVVPKTNIARTPHGYFRMSLAVADLLSAVVICGVMNTTYTINFLAHPFNERGEQLTTLHYHSQSYINGFGVTAISSLSASIFMLVIISMDRFAAICRPIVYLMQVCKQKSYASLTILTVWFLSFLIAIIPTWLPDFPYTLVSGGLIIVPEFFVVYITFLGFSLLGVWILNIALYILVKYRPTLMGTSGRSSSITQTRDGFKHNCRKSRTSWVSMTALINKRLSLTVSSTHENNNNRQERLQKLRCCSRKKLEVSLAKTVRYIVLAFSLALLPTMISIGLGRSSTLNPSSSNFNPIGKATWGGFSYISSRILFSNAFVNCIIYSYRSINFRKTLKAVLFCYR